MIASLVGLGIRGFDLFWTRITRLMEILAQKRALVFACVASFCFQILHLWLVPIIITYDGFEYIRYADLLGTARFHTEYYISRPPLYPALLRVSMELFGRNVYGVLLPGLILGNIGLLLIAVLLRRYERPLLSIFVLILTTLAPEFIAYQHTPLTEVGSFFFVALTIFALLYPRILGWRSVFLLAGTLGLGYYQRPTLIYLAPLVALLWLFRLRSEQYIFRWRMAMPQMALIVVLPFLLKLPWSQMISANPTARDMNRYMIGFGMLKGVLLPPTDSLMEPYRDAYIKAIKDSSPDGVLDASGLTQGSFVQFQWQFMSAHGGDADSVFLDSIQRYPGRYATSVLRCLVYFMGRDSLDDDNIRSARAIFDKGAIGSCLEGKDHPNYLIEVQYFRRETGRSILAKVLNKLIFPFRWLVVIGSALTCFGFILAIVRKDILLLTFSVVPLFYLLLHSLLLLSVNRYAIPVQPLILVNLLLVPVLILRPGKVALLK